MIPYFTNYINVNEFAADHLIKNEPFEPLSDDDLGNIVGRECDGNTSTPQRRTPSQYLQALPKQHDMGERSFPVNVTRAPSFHTNDDQQTKIANSPMLDGKFFKVIHFDATDHVEASCQLCLPNQKVIKGSMDTTTNFVKHLKRIHAAEFPAYTKYKVEKRKKRDYFKIGSPLPPSQFRQTTTLTSELHKKSVGQAEFNKRIVRCVINTISAVSIIDHPSFKAMFDGFNVQVIDRTSAMKTIQTMFKSYQDDLKMQISNQQFLCSTADIWTSKRRSFMGVTLHWLDDNLQRVSVALACQRVRGDHNSENIAEILNYTYAKYGIKKNQIIATVTDNGSNFVKVFKDFPLHSAPAEPKDNLNILLSDSDLDESESDAAMSISMCDSIAIKLQKHIRCASYSLNLIATNDCMIAISADAGVRAKHLHVFDKCRKLWAKAGRPGAAEIVLDVLGHSLTYPEVASWNAHFAAISRILHENTKPKLATLHHKLGLNHFNETEIQYLEDYCRIMKPLATALEILQGETNTYFGYLLPTLTSLANKWETMKADFQDVRHYSANLILNSNMEALLNRFSAVFKLECEEAIIAAVTCPKFKFRWFNALKNLNQTSSSIDSIKQMVILSTEQLLTSEKSEGCDTLEYDGYFDFSAYSDAPGPSHLHTQPKKSQELHNLDQKKPNIELELLHYIEDKRTNLSMLDDYPTIKKLFLRYNTCLPSSAAVQCLFSFETMMTNPCRHGLTDDNFEKLVVLKANKVGP